MKLRVTLLALSIMAMAWLALLLLKPDDTLAVAPPPLRVFPDPEPLPAPPPETAEQQAKRLKDLNPNLREAVIRIENAMRQWEAQNPEATDDDEWGEFLLGEIAKLDTPQLEALVDAVITSKAWGLPVKYYVWIYQAWGAREPAQTRDWMLRSAETQGMLDGPRSWDHRYVWDEISANLQAVQLGHARSDPAAAWQQMAEDLANPRMQYLQNEFYAEFILEFYAKQHPEKAWREIDCRRDLAFHLVPGFAMGAPPGQDWAARLDDYASLHRGANGSEAGADRAVNSLMARWLAEDLDAALAWMDFHLGLEDFLSARSFRGRTPPPELPGLEAPPDELLVQLEMMRDIHAGFWSRTRLMDEILTALISKGHRDLAALVIADRLGSWRWDPRLYPLIRSFPDPTLREALLLTAARKLPKPERDSTNREKAEEHMAVIYSLWTLSADIDVSEEARKQAKNLLREAYAAEKRIVALAISK